MRVIDIVETCLKHFDCIDCKYCEITKEGSKCTMIPEVNEKLHKYVSSIYMDTLINILLEEVNL